MLLGTNNEYAKAHNRRSVLEAIRRKGPISRAELARLTALTRPTISTIIQELIADGLVLETGRCRGKRGSPAVQLELNPDGGFAIGLDLDRDHLTAVLIDLGGAARQTVSQQLHYPSPEEALDLMVDVVESVLTEQRIARERLIGVGVGLPGPLNVSDAPPFEPVVAPLCFPGWHNVPIARALRARLKLPVVLENNATAAAIGESWYGGAQSLNTFFYCYFGIGLGGGVVIGGQPYRGFRGNAGELGYLPAPGAAPEAFLGKLLYLPYLYEQLAQAGYQVSIPDALAHVYDQGHPILLEWLERASAQLSTALFAIECLLDPEAIILGGRLPACLLDHFTGELDAALRRLPRAGRPYPTKLLRAQIGEHAAALGLAALPIYQAVAPNPKHLLKSPLSEARSGLMLEQGVMASDGGVR